MMKIKSLNFFLKKKTQKSRITKYIYLFQFEINLALSQPAV